MTEPTAEQKYPIFRNPEEYMAMRHQPGLWGRAKVWSERHALDQCFAVMQNVRTIVDVPSGPGRLFWYWRDRGLRVIGLDYSEQMVEASTKLHGELGLEGRVAHENAFELPEFDEAERPEVVASVRFAYYFEPDRRVELLRSLARASSRYLLVMYKTTETLKGYINGASDRERGKPPRQPHMAKAGCSHHQILREFTAAGLAVLKIQPIGEFSDRVYVVAEKVEAGAPVLAQGPPAPVRIQSGGSTRIGFFLVLTLFLFYFLSLSVREFWREPEALMGLAIRNAVAGNLITPWNGIPGDSFYLSLPMVWIASLLSWIVNSTDEITLRFINALCLAGGLAIPLLVARRMENRYVGILAAVMLATTYDFWKLAAEVRPEVTTMLFLGVAWLAAWSSIVRRAPGAFFLSWFSAGLAALSDGWDPLLLAAVAWVALPLLMRSRGLKPQAGGFRAIPLGLLVGLIPTVIWFAFAAPLSGVGVVSEWIRYHWVDVALFDAPWLVVWALFEGTLPWVLLIPIALVQRFRPGGRDRVSLAEDYCLSLALGMVLVFSVVARPSDEALAAILPWMMIPCAAVAWRWLLWVGDGVSEECARKDRRVWGTMMGRLPGKLFIGSAGLLLLSYTGATILLPLFQEDRDSPKTTTALIQRYTNGNTPLVMVGISDPRLLYYFEIDLIYEPEAEMGQAYFDDLLAEHPNALLLVDRDDWPAIEPFLGEAERIERIRYRSDRLFLIDPRPRG